MYPFSHLILHCSVCNATTHNPHIVHSPTTGSHLTCSSCGTQHPQTPQLDPSSPTSSAPELDDDPAFQLLSEAFGSVNLNQPPPPLTFASAHYIQPTYASLGTAVPVQVEEVKPVVEETKIVPMEGGQEYDDIEYARQWARSVGMDEWEVEAQIMAEMSRRAEVERQNQMEMEVQQQIQQQQIQQQQVQQQQKPPGIGVGDGCGVVNIAHAQENAMRQDTAFRDARSFMEFYEGEMDDEETPCAAFQRESYRCNVGQWV